MLFGNEKSDFGLNGLFGKKAACAYTKKKYKYRVAKTCNSSWRC